MEIHARTGGKLTNEDIERPYLKRRKTLDRPPIRYENLRRVEEDKFKAFEEP